MKSFPFVIGLLLVSLIMISMAAISTAKKIKDGKDSVWVWYKSNAFVNPGPDFDEYEDPSTDAPSEKPKEPTPKKKECNPIALSCRRNAYCCRGYQCICKNYVVCLCEKPKSQYLAILS